VNRNDISRFWAFVGDNIVSLATIAFGVGVIIWQRISTPSPDPVSLVILALLCLLATSELVERRRRLAKIQAEVDQIREANELLTRKLSQFPDVVVKRFSDYEQAIYHLCERVEAAKVCVQQASIDERRSTYMRAHDRFHKIRTKVIRDSKIDYRYLFQINERRVNNVSKWLEDTKGKFFAAGLNIARQPDDTPIGFLTFTIFDHEEVYVRPPYNLGQSADYLLIRNPEVVNLFSDWFNYLWSQAVRIDPHLPSKQREAMLKSLLPGVSRSDDQGKP
jgi:hypothetical protein